MAFDFPSSPTVGQVYQGYTWDAEKWASTAAVGAVRYDTAQTLTAAQKTQARANIDVPKRNYIINGAMQISQENGTTAVAGGYPVDQFNITGSTTGVISTVCVGATTPSGSPNRLRVTVSTADAAVAAGDYMQILQPLEGLRVGDLLFGTAAAKTVTVQFGCRGPAGTYSLALSNYAGTRSYVVEYVIAAGEANTDIQRSITIPGDTAGTWVGGNVGSMVVHWGLMAGTTYQQAAGSWGTVNAVGSSNQFNFMGTAGNVFELFDVGMYEGTVAPPFVVPDYATEFTACRRYWEAVGITASTIVAPYFVSAWYKSAKRTTPTFTLYPANVNGAVFGPASYSQADGVRQTTAATGAIDVLINANARM